MAERRLKLPGNAPGPYYVDDSCIDCDLCRSTSPRHFVRDEEAGFSIVRIQPVTAEEFAEAEEARLACPTESIGNDG